MFLRLPFPLSFAEDGDGHVHILGRKDVKALSIMLAYKHGGYL